MKIEGIEAVGFDWDGTLVDSMGVKAQCFAQSTIQFLPNLEGLEKEIQRIYIVTRGIPRTSQLSIVQEKFRQNSLKPDKLARWSDLFTNLYLSQGFPLFDCAQRVIDDLRKRNYRLFISSSVPQPDLDRTLLSYPSMEGSFKIILGTSENGAFKKGIPHLTFISRNFNISLEKIAFVGDGPDDVKGANEAGCFSVGIADKRIEGSREDIQRNNPKLIVEDLGELLNFF